MKKFAPWVDVSVNVTLTDDDCFEVHRPREGRGLVERFTLAVGLKEDGTVQFGIHYAKGRMYRKDGSLGVVQRNLFLYESDVPAEILTEGHRTALEEVLKWTRRQ